MKNGFKIIDSDMHIMEPLDLWENYIDPRFKDRAPRPVRVPTRGDLNLLMVDGKEPRQNSPTLAHDLRMISGKRSNTRGDVIDFARKQNFNAKSQLEAMDIEGIDVAVLFPTACLHIMTMADMDPLLAEAICRAYNDWLYDFCQENPQRLFGAALLPPHDVSLAVREAKRAREKLGFVSAFLRATPLPGQTWFSVYWEPLWAELEETGMTVGFHECTNSGHYPHLERFGMGNRLLRHICTHVTGQMVTMVDIIVGGVLERFPQLKVAFLECNCGWAPSWLQRMDRHWAPARQKRRTAAHHEAQRLFQTELRDRLRGRRSRCWLRRATDWRRQHRVLIGLPAQRFGLSQSDAGVFSSRDAGG